MSPGRSGRSRPAVGLNAFPGEHAAGRQSSRETARHEARAGLWATGPACWETPGRAGGRPTRGLKSRSAEDVGVRLLELGVQPRELDSVGYPDRLELVEDLQDDPRHDEGVDRDENRRRHLLAEEGRRCRR